MIYQLKPDMENFQNLTLVNDNEFDRRMIINNFVGTPIGDQWLPLECKILFEEGVPEEPASDFPLFGTPVFSKRAVEVLRDLLMPNGEILPLTFEGRQDMYFAFNTITVINALDEYHSEVTRFSDGKIMWINKYQFFSDKLKSAAIFKIPQSVRSLVYVKDKFVNKVNEAGLTGFNFAPLWSDKHLENN